MGNICDLEEDGDAIQLVRGHSSREEEIEYGSVHEEEVEPEIDEEEERRRRDAHAQRRMREIEEGVQKANQYGRKRAKDQQLGVKFAPGKTSRILPSDEAEEDVPLIA